VSAEFAVENVIFYHAALKFRDTMRLQERLLQGSDDDRDQDRVAAVADSKRDRPPPEVEVHSLEQAGDGLRCNDGDNDDDEKVCDEAEAPAAPAAPRQIVMTDVEAAAYALRVYAQFVARESELEVSITVFRCLS